MGIVFLATIMCQMYKILLFSTLADQNWPYLLFFKALALKPNFRFWRPYWIFEENSNITDIWHQLHIIYIFHVYDV